MSDQQDYEPVQYPKWVFSEVLGKDIIVNDHVEHSVHVGVEHGPDGKPLDAPEAPPESVTNPPEADFRVISEDGSVRLKLYQPEPEERAESLDGEDWRPDPEASDFDEEEEPEPEEPNADPTSPKKRKRSKKHGK